jgi:phage gp16-like protein
MELRVTGSGPAAPFLGARDVFETAHDLERPVHVRVRDSPDERTWAGHYDDHHVLNISRQAATSVMARELALHEFSHMHCYEHEHPSHVLSMDEVLFLALTGREVERRVLAHCYQIANHVKDIYADDITLSVGPTDKLVTFLESELAAAVADRPVAGPRAGQRLTAGADPSMTAVNAAFALALLERNGAVDDSHRIYDLAHAAAEDAPEIDVEAFREQFAALADDPDESECRRGLVDAIRTYVDAQDTTAGPAAD